MKRTRSRPKKPTARLVVATLRAYRPDKQRGAPPLTLTPKRGTHGR